MSWLELQASLRLFYCYGRDNVNLATGLVLRVTTIEPVLGWNGGAIPPPLSIYLPKKVCDECSIMRIEPHALILDGHIFVITTRKKTIKQIDYTILSNQIMPKPSNRSIPSQLSRSFIVSRC